MSEYGNIRNVISDFVNSLQERGPIETFLDGYCYEFACMLKRSFTEGNIFFIVEEKHMVFEYKGNYYDITGLRNDLPNGKTLIKDNDEF